MTNAPASRPPGTPLLVVPSVPIFRGIPASALGVPPLVWVCGAVLLGCAFGPTRGSAGLIVAALGLAALPLAAVLRSGAGWSAGFAVLTFGVALWHAAPVTTRPVQWPPGEVQGMRGVVLAWPVISDRSTRVLVHTTSVRTDGSWEAADATLTVFLPSYPSVARGDAVYLTGTVRLRAEGESDGVLFARFASVERANRQTTPDYLRHAITTGLRTRVEAHVRPPESGVIVGMLLGERAAPDAATREALNATGTTHLIVVSGSNIALVAGLFAAAGRGIGGRRQRLWAVLSLAGIAAYTFAVGADAPVVRAAIMGGAGLVAPLVGRRADALASLALAAAIMALLHPPVVASLSFLLSLAATFGVLIVAPWLRRQMERVAVLHAVPWLTAPLSVTLAAQLLTEPLAWHVFGRVSLVAPLVNVAVEPLVPLIMATGAAAAVSGGVPVLFVGEVVGAVASLPAWLFVRIIRFGAAVPFASVLLPQPGFGLTVACYLVPALAALIARWRAEQYPWHLTRATWWSVGGFAAVFAVALVGIALWG